MKLSLVLAAVALADPGLAGAVTAAPEITGVINHGPRQPFKPLPKNGTTHGLVNATGLAVPTGGPVRGVWRPFADKPIEALDCSESVAAASMTAGPASQGAPSSAQVPFKKVSKGKRDMFEKAARESGGDSGHAEGTGTDKKKSTAPHQINSLSADFVTKSLGGKKPWTRSSSGVPKNAGRKFKEALGAKNAKASPQAPWTKKVDHGKGSSSSSQSDRKAKTSTGTPKVHGRKFKEAPAAKKGKATGNRPVSSTTVHNGKGKTTSHQHSAGQTRTKRPSSVSHNHNHLPTGKKTKIPRRSLANTPETISADNTPQPIHRRTSDTPFGIKKGLVYKNGAVTPSFSRDGSATWAYNWGAASGAPMFQQIPMYWGPRNKGDAAGVMERVREGAPWVLGYNEPDMVWRGGGGCEVSAREACEFLMPFFWGVMGWVGADFGGVDDAWGIDMFPFYNEGARLVWYVSLVTCGPEGDKTDK